jgi:hypothetical protein
VAVVNIAGCKVKATAFDIPENEAELQVAKGYGLFFRETEDVKDKSIPFTF